ncbi:MAG: hypothetical protein ACYDA3_01725 [Gaiellaceae bacterium]
MKIVNRRNAVLGWTVWNVGKRMAKRKAKNALPGRSAGAKRPTKKPAILAAVAALGGLLFWRKKSADTPPEA